MKTAILSMALLAASMCARADFSYTTTMKSSAGMMAGVSAMEGRVTKHYLKGNRVKWDHGDTALIFDMDAETIARINNTQKTYTVTKFSDLPDMREAMKKAEVEMTFDVKNTGQRKNVNGYNAHEVVMTMDMDSPQARQMGAKTQMECDIWISSDVPGSQELAAFYKRNAGRFPWSTLASGNSGGNPRVQRAVTDLYRKMASIDGVPVLQVVRMKMIGASAQMAQAQEAMAQARAQIEEARKKGGQEAAAAEQALAMMGKQGTPGSMFETTTESGNFSTNSIPDSAFAIPAGYQKTERK